MNLTATQKTAVTARGNVLVVAGAGTGKTHTLVERCLHCLLDEKSPASIDEILMVTFTDAAAAEMRRRIRARLEQEMRANPANPRWPEQLALFETAHIGTLHSFCLELVRQHFYSLELDPQLNVLAEEEAHLLAEEELRKLLQEHYAGKTETAAAVQQMIQDQFKGWEKPVRALVLRLHRYSQALPDPSGWFRAQFTRFTAAKPTEWLDWLTAELIDWRERSLVFLQKRAATNGLAAQALAALKAVNPKASRAETAAVLERVRTICRDCPHGKKGEWQKPLDAFIEEADFLFSLANLTPEGDPLNEDWNWIRGQMLTLLRLAKDFGDAYANAKRELAMLDFNDLEQHALRLLWDHSRDEPTKLARDWQRKLRFIFVDEYQDINAAQDKIIEALSRDGAEANRFLVGDVKQSIYRFRLADPSIFQRYLTTWSGASERARLGHSNAPSPNGPYKAHDPPLGQTDALEGRTLLCPSRARSEAAPSQIIPLLDNFRSREGILNFINSVFPSLMRAELGGVEYDERARLRFGDPETRKPLAAATDTAPRVELHLRIKRNSPQPETADDESSRALLQLADLEDADKEARLVALRLRALRAEKHLIWDEASKQMRPMEWRDVAVLLRSPARKAESYARQFARLNVPLLVARGGFYESIEVMDLLSLLQILDNPLQDVPLLAVLRSPLVGLRLNELAELRLAKKGHFWNALTHWELARIQNSTHDVPNLPDGSKVQTTDHEPRTTNESETLRKVSQFLSRFSRWRRLARQISLSQCLNAILAETHYASWLLTQPRGEQRQANAQRLLALTRQFDQFQRQGLFRFLLFIEAQQLAETEPDVAAVSEDNSVRLMSIHQSKGLEFPIVVVADLGKSFNLMDLRADIILDQELGLCPHVKPPHTGKRYPSLPYWLAARRQHRELLGEELRLLYVAMTRARDTLLLTGNISEGRLEKACERAGEMDEELVASARSYSEWLLSWLVRHAVSKAVGGNSRTLSAEGQNALVRWVLHEELHLLAQETAPQIEDATEQTWKASPTVWQALQERLAWKYPFLQAAHEPAKTTVSALRRRAATEETEDEESTLLFWERPKARIQNPWPGRRRFASGEEVGQAHHRFLQFASLAATGSVNDLQREAERLVHESILTKEQTALLDFDGLAAFWQSGLGQKVLAQRDRIRRELPFTARFSLAELNLVSGKTVEPASADEFVVVQGIADLVVMLPHEIWLLDFKTDAINLDQLAEKTTIYEPQLKLYATALSRIHRKPVTQCWFYFLSVRQAVEISQPQLLPA